MNSRRSLILAMLLAPLATLHAEDPMVVFEPKPRMGPLLNPGKGWSAHGSAKWQPKEVLDWVGMGVIRLDWAALEPREGEFNWTPLDQVLEEWASIGRVCNIGVTCANTHSKQPDGYATPKWVFDAGAKKTEMNLTPEMATQGTSGHKVAPVFDDPVFLEKYRHFLKAFASRYDGDPRIAILDIRSYGNWGESHMHPFKVPDIAPEIFREHEQMHLDAFKKTQLCISRNSHLGRFGPLREVWDWAVQGRHAPADVCHHQRRRQWRYQNDELGSSHPTSWERQLRCVRLHAKSLDRRLHRAGRLSELWNQNVSACGIGEHDQRVAENGAETMMTGLKRLPREFTSRYLR